MLKLANLPQARNLLIAISNGFEAGSVCESGRKLNPGISIIARAYSAEEEAFLRNLGATAVIRGEREIGKGILMFLRGDGGNLASAAMPVPEEPRLPVVENLLEKAALADVVAPPDAVIELPPPATVASDPVVIAAGDAASIPDDPASEPAAAGLESVDATPAVGEAPAAIDEVVVPAAEPEAASGPAEATAEIDAETAAEAADETSEGGIAPPEPDAENKDEPTVPPVVPEPKS
jgi:CPA2 family monovalent cation:H+ antiporter-2